jgi:hypothetical protein
MAKTAQFVTTVPMPHSVRALLDLVKAKRAVAMGKRPSTGELVVEALEAFVARELPAETLATVGNP